MQRTNTPGLSLIKVLFVVVLLVSMITLAGTASATRDRPGVQRASQTGPYATSSGAVNVRVGPGTGFAIAGLLSTGEAVPILGVSPDGGWWYVAAPFGEGWVSNISVTAANTSGVPVRDPGPMATVASGALNVRSGPGPFAGVLGQLRQGAQVLVLGQNPDGSWLQVRSPHGVAGIRSTGCAQRRARHHPGRAARDRRRTLCNSEAAYLNVRQDPETTTPFWARLGER